MRDSVINSIKGLALTGYNVSVELPFDDGGAEMYLRNPKTVYVDTVQTERTPLISTLDGVDISTTTKSTTAYFTIDAKNPPLNYDSTIASLESVKNAIELDGANRREAFVTTSYSGDLLITQVEYTLTRVN